MDDILNEIVSTDDLKKFEKIYHEQLYANKVTPKAQFEYAWCLVRSNYTSDIKKGIVLLQELYRSHEEGQRDYLYYLAIGNARLKEFNTALHYINSFLLIEPGNQQVLTLERSIKKKMDRDGLVGIAVSAGVVLTIGAVVGGIVALASKSKS